MALFLVNGSPLGAATAAARSGGDRSGGRTRPVDEVVTAMTTMRAVIFVAVTVNVVLFAAIIADMVLKPF